MYDSSRETPDDRVPHMAAPYIPPAGTSELGTIDLAPNQQLPKPPVIRADQLNYRGQRFTSVFNDRDPVDAAVIECLWRGRGSGAAVQNTSARYFYVTKLGDDAATLIENEARLALKRLIQSGVITVTSVEVMTGADWAEVAVNYLNNRTPLEKERRAVKRLPEEFDDGTT